MHAVVFNQGPTIYDGRRAFEIVSSRVFDGPSNFRYCCAVLRERACAKESNDDPTTITSEHVTMNEPESWNAAVIREGLQPVAVATTGNVAAWLPCKISLRILRPTQYAYHKLRRGQ